jgi:6-phosphofructokinase 2
MAGPAWQAEEDVVIVTVTLNPSIDSSTRVDRVVADRKLRCDAPRFEPGGGGINVSRAVAQLGGTSKALYTAGGHAGEQLKELMDAEGISHEPLAIGGRTRTNLMVMASEEEQQYRFGMPGPDLGDEWRACLDRVLGLESAPEYLVVSGSVPPGVPDDIYAQIASWGRQAGIRVVVDTSGEPLRAAATAGAYLLKPNLRELSVLAGTTVSEDGEQVQAAESLVEEGSAEVVLVTLGSGGALLVRRSGCTRLRAPTVPIRSKVGAGDSTVAGMVLALSRGHHLEAAARFGIAAGAAAVMSPGTELCRREDTERLYEQIRSEG